MKRLLLVVESIYVYQIASSNDDHDDIERVNDENEMKMKSLKQPFQVVFMLIISINGVNFLLVND